jgi:predicted dehydrogenase
MNELGVAVIGAGYWGPNLIRNFTKHGGCDLRWVCDLDQERAQAAVGRYSTVKVTSSLDDLLDDPTVKGVAIATPPSTHTELALACIEAGKHVLVDKPLAPSLAEGQKLVAAAEDRDVVLMCDHTYCYTPAVRQIKELIDNGTLGDIEYIDSVRINLGLIRPDVDVVWDLGPHDLSILDFILPESQRPTAVSAFGADPVGAGQACLAYLNLRLPGDAVAHAHLNWLSPTKIRTTIIGGSKQMVIWDDVHPSQRLSIFDRGVARNGPDDRVEAVISYRTGDMVAPALKEKEALTGVIDEFVASIAEHRAPLTDGHAGLRVLSILEGASRSLATGGGVVDLAVQA